MKKKGILASIFVIPLLIVGIKKLINRRKVKLVAEDKNLMDKILENQQKLKEVCDDQEVMVQKTVELIDKLRKDLDEPEYGIDPTTIEVSIPEVEGA